MQLVDDDLVHVQPEHVENVLEKVVREWPRRLDVLELESDGLRFEAAYDDRELALSLDFVENERIGAIGVRTCGKTEYIYLKFTHC